tara:strand:+ start:266 stop:556 length:291 start_codon:yes stop_codon:yes gene_type:complete
MKKYTKKVIESYIEVFKQCKELKKKEKQIKDELKIYSKHYNIHLIKGLSNYICIDKIKYSDIKKELLKDKVNSVDSSFISNNSEMVEKTTISFKPL